MPARPRLRSLLRVLGGRLARTRGSLRVTGITADVTINRDRWGIPHIEASDDADAWFGLGFCHGQDRAFQLELLARAGRGTLAALVGPAGLPIDRLSRTLGFGRMAATQVAALDEDVIATVTAYVAGVNAAALATPRPHELVILRAQRSSWRVDDVLAFLGLQSLSLAGNWDAELARLQILLLDGPESLRAVDPTYAPWLPAVMPVGVAAGPLVGRLAADVTRLRDLVGGSGASNAWAVSGSRTATGSPILANDPHLGPSLPAPWYLAHLRTPDWEVAGASFVGGPAFPGGHNGHAAWGITAGCTDSADLFWEEINLEAGTVRGPDGPETLERIPQEIEVRGRQTVVHEVLVTPRGPILTPLLDDLAVALSLRATWLEPVAVRGFLDVHRSRDFSTFREGFRAWPGPALNVVYADVAGHIGWQLTGALPRRRAGYGTVPLPAWEAEHGWEADHLPFDDLPWLLDPDAGFVASANNAPRSDALDQPFLGVDWLDGYRAARIVEGLAERTDWDMNATAALQVDVASLPWRELRPLVIDTPVSRDAARSALELLAGWDGVVSAGSAAASVYELFVAELAASTAREAAPKGWRWALGAGVGPAIPRTAFGARIISHLVQNLSAGDHESAIETALASAVTTLTHLFGPQPSAWAWGNVRPLRLLHPLGVRRLLDGAFNLGPVLIGGDSNTVAQAGIQPLHPLGNPAAIANHRTIIDLADVERSRYVIAGGQSGNPLSSHYGDLFELWQRGEGVPIAWSVEAVQCATVDRLLLRPQVPPPDRSYISPSNDG